MFIWSSGHLLLHMCRAWWYVTVNCVVKMDITRCSSKQTLHYVLTFLHYNISFQKKKFHEVVQWVFLNSYADNLFHIISGVWFFGYIINMITSCVIVEDGKVIASGRNRTTETRNVRSTFLFPFIFCHYVFSTCFHHFWAPLISFFLLWFPLVCRRILICKHFF